MHIREAVESRYSCRAFLPKPVPEKIVREILTSASRAPSGGNLQPWIVHVLADKRLEELKALIRPRLNELPLAEGSEYEVYPAPLKQPYKERRFKVGESERFAIRQWPLSRTGLLGFGLVDIGELVVVAVDRVIVTGRALASVVDRAIRA